MIKDRLIGLGSYAGATVLALDQLSKNLIVSMVMTPVPQTVPVTGWFNLVLSWNKGVTFGMFNHAGGQAGMGMNFQPYILSGIALLIVALLFRWLTQAETLFAALGLGMVMGGATGNIIDRVRFGAVVDFLDFHWQGWHWYAFNLADSAIVGGVICLLADQAWQTYKAKKAG